MLTLWSDEPGVSIFIWFVAIILVMYCGRQQAHQVLRSTGSLLYGVLRAFSRAIGTMEQRLVERNREILLASGTEDLERSIEREFTRVNKAISQDLGNYPALHRQISDVIDTIEQDFIKTTDSPPLPPAWLDAVGSIAAIPRNGDPAVCKILNNIQKTVKSAYSETQKEFKKSSLQQHRLLAAMQPMWRSISQSLNTVKGKMDRLDERSVHIDSKMESYEKMRSDDNGIMRVLAASSLTQFFISGLVLIVAVLGGVINFQLIAMPMSEMVGGTSQIGDFNTSDVAALVIIMIEIAMGLFLMETLRITRLFPVIGSLDDAMRKRMMVITFSILAILAGIEASLAYMRDLLALDREALTQSLAGVSVVETQFRWIPSIGQMVMGFILPFALAFIAIPLESFIHSLRTVLGMLAIICLHLISVISRVVGMFLKQTFKIMINIYDFIIMVPLFIERMFKDKKKIIERELHDDPLYHHDNYVVESIVEER